MAMVSSRHTAAMSWKRATDQRLMRKRSSHHIRKRTWGGGGEGRGRLVVGCWGRKQFPPSPSAQQQQVCKDG